MERLTAEQRRKNMQAVRASGSKIETALAKALFAKGLRYRKNEIAVFGKPDLTYKKYELAVFVDSEFWHGKDWETKKYEHKSNQEFWKTKIKRIIERDKKVNEKLIAEGWKILRFWGKDITKNIDKCITKNQKTINETERKIIN
jgi:DNA mismatch endonuclease Vsr